MRFLSNILTFVATAFVLLSVWAGALEPELKWSYTAASNLYAPPLAADVCPDVSGKETILSDSEARRLRCISATGAQIWECNGNWKKRLASAASLSFTARPEQALLAIGNGDGTITCIDARTGAVMWQQKAGKIEWGAVIWADLDGDGKDEAVAGTEDAGILAFDSEGKQLWNYRDGGISIECPMAAADVDQDGRMEVFALGKWGPICLNGDGTRRWESRTADMFAGAPVIADANHDAVPELYCCSSTQNALHLFNAVSGEHAWQSPMVGHTDTYPSSSIAVGDINQDSHDEIVVSDHLGYVYCINARGERLWTFATEKRIHAAPSMGDVDGDGEVDILIASGDHYLYCVDRRGTLKWRYAADLRLIYPATITDLEDDGKTDILFCGGDHVLRCLTLGGRYAPERIPWPSRRFDVAQSGSSFGRSEASDVMVGEAESLLSNSSFELSEAMGDPKDYPEGSNIVETLKQRPRGWHIASGTGAWVMDSEAALDGEYALKVSPQRANLEIETDEIDVPLGLKSVSASVFLHGLDFSQDRNMSQRGRSNVGPNGTHAALRWCGLQGTLSEEILLPAGEQPSAKGGPWRKLQVEDVVPPPTARWVSLVCVTAASNREVRWDAATLTGQFRHPRILRALVNQVGYDVSMPKQFTVQANFVADKATFEVLADDSSVVFTGTLEPRGRIVGAYDNDWGFNYWRGDFTAFDTPGHYRIRITLDEKADTSWPFEIAPDLLWEKTARPAYRFFYYQRCGFEVPGFHKACHLDDSTNADHTLQYDLAGGWHDAGDYNKYHNAPYAYGLVLAYGLQSTKFDRHDDDHNGIGDFLDEILWGADHVRRMTSPDGSAYGPITSGYGYWGPPEMETDNQPLTGDERTVGAQDAGHDPASHAAALAKVARYVKENTGFVEAADRGLTWCLGKNLRGALPFSCALDLYRVTKDDKYLTLAKEMFPGANADDPSSVWLFDELTHGDHREELRRVHTEQAEQMLALAENPFGVYTYGPKEKTNFFGTPSDRGGWHVGNSRRVLDAATTVARAYQFNPDPRYLRFIWDQFNWIFGNNPYDLCLMEGLGSHNPPTYHNRLTFAGVPRGAVPGSIVNGITWRDVGDDRPYFDMRGLDIPDYEPNEVWLPHNTSYLLALTTYESVRERRE